MFKKKCMACAKKVERSFNFCPHCGNSFKVLKEKKDYGAIGKNDFGKIDSVEGEIKLPFGMNKIVNSLIKQLESQMNGNGQAPGKVPSGIKIRISTGLGNDPSSQIIQEERGREIEEKISIDEIKRRSKLPKIEAESSIKRLGDRIVYEITMPGVKSKRDVIITTLESGVEIRAYSEKYCYVKEIPMTIEIVGYYLRNQKLFLEIKA